MDGRFCKIFNILTANVWFRGGVGEDRCAILTNNDAIKVQFKNTYSFRVAIFNVYMVRSIAFY